jgi:5-bromo-4-chloroindolyl phosphate hydrolysis protein
MQFREDGTGKREGELFKWDLERNTNLTISWVKLIQASKYIKVMNDAESMQTISKQVKVYVVGGKNITILEQNDKYYEVTETDNYSIIELTDTSLKVSFKTGKGQTVRMSHTKQ